MRELVLVRPRHCSRRMWGRQLRNGGRSIVVFSNDERRASAYCFYSIVVLSIADEMICSYVVLPPFFHLRDLVFAYIFDPPTRILGHLDTMSKAGDFEAVAADIKKILHQPEYDDGSAGPVLVRLAWHSSGTYCAETDTGGSNGAGMRYEVICYC
jgi:hypothetical protein